MKKNVYRVIISGIMLSLLGGVIYCFYSRWYKSYSFDVHFDSFFSLQACHEITVWLDQAHFLYFPHQLISKLPKRFACIKSVRYIYKPRGTYDIFIGCNMPRIVLNSSWVITDQGLVTSYHYFTADCLKELPRITSEDLYREIPTHVCRMLLSIPSVIFQKYSIKLCDLNTIVLINKQWNKCSMLVDKDSLNNVLKIEKTYQLFSTKNNNKSNNKNYIYDIRFNNQILEYVMKGKWDDEKQKDA